MERQVEDVPDSFERSLRNAETRKYVLRLYVSGFTPASTRAISNLRTACENDPKGRFEVEVIDILQRLALVKGEQIIATPTLVRLLPATLQRLIGELSGAGKLFGLDLRPRRQGLRGSRAVLRGRPRLTDSPLQSRCVDRSNGSTPC